MDAISPRRHTFHIPVMGTGFTIDTPLRVARYGIASVVSLVDDELVERVRQRWCERAGEPYEAISCREDDARARRITAYLDLIDRLVRRQTEELRRAPFEPGSEITRYFELLPDGPLRERYERMRRTGEPEERRRLEAELRASVTAGSVDVNVMTKLDRALDARGRKRDPDRSDALAALRGFANSTVRASVVMSAGLNARLYGYAGSLPAFLPDAEGRFQKKLVLKVGSLRSAEVQMRFLAKRGAWVSELRLESGLNCGGHAFASEGQLLGPVLEELVSARRELGEQLLPSYNTTLEKRGLPPLASPPEILVTVQGGIGTAAEDALLRRRYGADGTGWGTPFLLVPEATVLDGATRRRLAESGPGDVFLSDSSPLGVPFWNLRTSASEDARRARIAQGRPGSPCPKGFLAVPTDLSDVPLCAASRAFQRRKLTELEAAGAAGAEVEAVVEKSCICHDLGGSAAIEHGFDAEATPAVCPGPNVVNFDRVYTLDEMVGHIYGRDDLLARRDRPHVFVRELQLSIEYLRKQQETGGLGAAALVTFRDNLLAGIDHYEALAASGDVEPPAPFVEALGRARADLDAIALGDGPARR